MEDSNVVKTRAGAFVTQCAATVTSGKGQAAPSGARSGSSVGAKDAADL